MEVTELLASLDHACAVIRRDKLREESADTPEVRAAYAIVEEHGEMVAKLVNTLASADLVETFGGLYKDVSVYINSMTLKGWDIQTICVQLPVHSAIMNGPILQINGSVPSEEE